MNECEIKADLFSCIFLELYFVLLHSLILSVF